MTKLLQAKKGAFTIPSVLVATLLLVAMGAGLLTMCLKSRIFSPRTIMDIAVNATTEGPSASPPASQAAQKVLISSIVYSENKSSVVIDDRIVHEGDTIGGVAVVKIYRDRVEVEKEGTEATIRWTQKIGEAPSAHWR